MEDNRGDVGTNWRELLGYQDLEGTDQLANDLVLWSRALEKVTDTQLIKTFFGFMESEDLLQYLE